MSDTFDHEADAWDAMLFGEVDDYPLKMRRQSFSIHCKYCHKGGFAWTKTEKGFRLFDKERKIHSCLSMQTLKD